MGQVFADICLGAIRLFIISAVLFFLYKVLNLIDTEILDNSPKTRTLDKWVKRLAALVIFTVFLWVCYMMGSFDSE